MIAFALVAGCGADGTSGAGVTVTAPQGFGESLYGSPVTVAWTVTAPFDPARTSVSLVSREDQAVFPILDHGVGSGETTAPTATGFSWAGNAVDGKMVPPGYYDLSIDVGQGFVDAGDSHVIVVQGVVFTSPASGASITVAAGATANLELATSNVSSITVNVYVGNTKGPSFMASSELHPIGHTLTWSTAQVAPGSYPVSAEIIAPEAALTYQMFGGTVIVQ